jgi:hypothetical protein
VRELDAVRHDCAKLEKGLEAASKVLGAAHPAVEAARRDLLRMQSKERASRHEQLLEAAAERIADAVGAADAGDEEELVRAIAEVDRSGLGPAHPIVEQGRAALARIRRAHQEEERMQREDEVLLVLEGAMRDEEGGAVGAIGGKDGAGEGVWDAWTWLCSYADWEEVSYTCNGGLGCARMRIGRR